MGGARRLQADEARAGECPERQRGRTVNPLAMPSQVRVLLPPPFPNRTANHAATSGLASQVFSEGSSRRGRPCSDLDHGAACQLSLEIADVAVVLQRGRIRTRGTRAELLARWHEVEDMLAVTHEMIAGSLAA
jgi:hypothetical protein